MKKLVIPILLMLASTCSFGQWSPPSNNTGFITTSHNNRTNDFGLNLESSGGNYQYFIENNINGANRQVFYFGHANSTKNIFGISASFNSGSTWVSSFAITQNGNVGIGTTTPNTKLQVKGPIKGDEVIAVETNGSYKVAMNGQSDGYIAGRDNSFIQKFLIRSNGVSFFNGGNVGIGTNQPDSKLTVKGNIHAEEVKVDLSVPGPDYVFKEDYDLRTLDEVQEYIQANGHLPNIPSAREMEEHGVELGTMNMKLLEKIEELTLYTLQQKEKLKRMESLEQELKIQKEEIEELKRLIRNLYE